METDFKLNQPTRTTRLAMRLEESSSPYFSLGKLLKEVGRRKEAVERYRQAVAFHEALNALPSNPECRNRLAWSHNNLGNVLRLLAFGATPARNRSSIDPRRADGAAPLPPEAEQRSPYPVSGQDRPPSALLYFESTDRLHGPGKAWQCPGHTLHPAAAT